MGGSDFERGFVSLTGTLTRENGALVRRSSNTRRSQRTFSMTYGLRDVLKFEQKKDRLLPGGA